MPKFVINTIIEIVGFPKEHIEKTMNSVIEKIKEDKKVKLISHSIREPKEVKNMWSTFTEFKVEFKDPDGNEIIDLKTFPLSIKL